LKEEALKRLINANVNDVQVDFISLFVDLVSGGIFDKLIVCLSELLVAGQPVSFVYDFLPSV
jgi:hypothetical protein